MINTKVAALAAALAACLPAMAQETIQTTPPSTAQQDEMKTEREIQKSVGNPNVHWTYKEKMELLQNAPYIRPRDWWELTDMLDKSSSYDEDILLEALSKVVRVNMGDFYDRRLASERYWLDRANAISTTTTTRTENAGTVTVTTETTRAQPMGTAMVFKAMSRDKVYRALQKDLDAGERGAFRQKWDDMTDAQIDAIVNIVNMSGFYYANPYAPYRTVTTTYRDSN